MRHIEYPDGKSPPQEWLDRANALTADLKTAQQAVASAANEAQRAAAVSARNKIIGDNDNLWGEIKEWLMTFSHDKCWFTEAHDTASDYHVEHFRPKKRASELDKTERDGYWWLAFDFRNYRLSGGVPNAKKSVFFPLRPSTNPATCPENNCEDEECLLLDPTKQSDVVLLTFVDGGRAEPSEPNPPGGWFHERARHSIERYKLNEHPPLSRAREAVWKLCTTKIQRLEELLGNQKQHPSSARRTEIESESAAVKALTKPHAPFSRVARAFLEQHPEKWVQRLIA